jgi:uncharacterized membrane protein YfcA
MMAPEYLLLPLIAFAAFILKGLTGFGPAIVVVAFGSLIMAPRDVIAMSALLDTLAGAMLLGMDWDRSARRFWLPLALAIVLGSLLGSLFLDAIPPEAFRHLLSGAICFLGLWFLLEKPGKRGRALLDTLPARGGFADRGMTFLGGVCGGLFGISGPPIIWHFGRRFAKRAFRQVLIPIFLAAAVSRVTAYTWLGILDRHTLWYVLLALPGLFAGVLLGNRIFVKISEGTFRRVIGVLLILAAIRIYLK